MQNTLRTIAFMTVLTMLLMFVGNVIGGQGGMIFALLMAAVMNVGSYWFSDTIVIKMYRGKEVTDGPLFDVVSEIVQRNNLPMPKVCILPQPTPNAFATGRNPEHAVVAATEGIMHILDRDELTGVMAHEMAHVTNRDILIGSIAATIAGAISYLAYMAQWAAIFGGGSSDDEEGGHPFVLLLVAIIAPMAAMVVQMAVSRSREYEADRLGAQMAGNPRWLANALRKLETANRQVPMDAGEKSAATQATAHMFIVSPLSAKGMAGIFSTHPPVEERVRRLEGMAVGS